MSTRAMSPGGALLRASRLFSLPPTLPPPPGDYSAVTKHTSDSATRPYPTAQAITTPESSRKRGDWGLKRPLPLKTTTRTSTPLIRVRQLDSWEGVTDFGSSSDHAITLEKFQELRVPITIPASRGISNMGLPEKSVFEEDHDFTAAPDAGRDPDADDKRWKFRGPWLAGMTEGDFHKYLRKQVRSRRAEFRQFLRERLAAEVTQAARERAMDEGAAGEAVPTVAAGDVTDEQLTAYLRRLRMDRPTLYNMVSQFLDLAPVQPASAMEMLGSLAPQQSRELKTGNPYARDGPPITHPSAGVSYLRTASYIDNHPVYGPQKTHPPVKARIIAPRNQNTGNFSAKLGVGGLVTEVPQGATAFNVKPVRNTTRELIPGLNDFDPAVTGGSKAFVQPASAKVDSQGRVVLKVAEAQEEASLVQKELAGETKIFGQTPKPEEQVRTPAAERLRRRIGGGPRMMGSTSTYGLNL